MIRARTALSSFARRFQSAQAAQSGWERKISEAQGQLFRGTATVRAESRKLVDEGARSEVTTVAAFNAAARSPQSATTAATAWQEMVHAANLVERTTVSEQPKVTVKVRWRMAKHIGGDLGGAGATRARIRPDGRRER